MRSMGALCILRWVWSEARMCFSYSKATPVCHMHKSRRSQSSITIRPRDECTHHKLYSRLSSRAGQLARVMHVDRQNQTIAYDMKSVDTSI